MSSAQLQNQLYKIIGALYVLKTVGEEHDVMLRSIVPEFVYRTNGNAYVFTGMISAKIQL